MKKEKLKNICIIVVFCSILLLFGLGLLLNVSKTYSYSEKRKLAEFPKFSVDTVMSGEFMEGFEEYVNDHFLWRDEFVSVGKYLEYASGKREINGVLIGKNDYLYSKFEVNSQDKAQITKNIGYLNDLAEREDIIVMLIPTAESVSKENLPFMYSGVNQKELIREIYSKVECQTVDVLSLMRENKEGIRDIFYKSDPHWTMRGSYYGYVGLCEGVGIAPISYERCIFEKVKDGYKGSTYSKIRILKSADTLEKMTTFPCVSVKINEKEEYKDLFFPKYLESIDEYSFYLGGNNPIVRVSSDCGNERKLLIIRDSFSHTLVPYLANNFSEIVLLDLRYYKLSLKKLLDKENFDDIVLVYSIENFKNERNLVFLTQ